MTNGFTQRQPVEAEEIQGFLTNLDQQEKDLILAFQRDLLPPQMRADVEEAFRRGILPDPRIPENRPFGFMGRGTRPPTRESITEAIGISEAGAPTSARTAASFGFDDLVAARGALAKEFGFPVEVFREERLGGDIVFVDPNTGTPTVFDPSKAELGDIADIAGESITLGTEIGAAVIGGLASAETGPGAIAAVNISSGFGAFTGELIRLKEGQRRGVVELSDSEIIEEAAKLGGISLVAGTIGDTAFRIARRLLGGGDVIDVIARDVDMRALLAGRASAEAFQKEFAERTGEVFPLTLGDILRAGDVEAAKPITGAEATLAARGRAPEIRAVEQEQRIGRDIAERQVAAESGVSQVEVGARIQQTAAEREAAQRLGIEVQERSVARRAEQTAQAISGRGTLAEPGAALGDARSILAGERDVINKRISNRFAEIEVGLGDTPISLTGFKQGVKELQKGLEEGFFTTSGDLQKVAQALAKGDEVSLRTVAGGLSDLKADIRGLKSGRLVADPRIGTLVRLRNSLTRARANAFKNEPDKLAKIEAIEEELFQFRQNVDRGLIGSLVTKENGIFKISDNRAFTAMLNNREAAEQAARALDDPQFGFSIGAKNKLRESILARFKDAFTNADGTLKTAKQFETEFRKFSPTLKAFFNKEELGRLRNAGAARRMIDEFSKRKAAAIRNINREIGTELQDWDPARVARESLSSANPSRVVKIDQLLTGDRELRRQYRKALQAELRLEISTFENGFRRVNPNALAAFDEARLNALGTVFGKQWRKDFDLLRQAASFAAPGARAATDLATQSARSPVLAMVSRFMRVPFPPLTKRGRALTAVLGANSEKWDKLIAKALADPDTLRLLTEARNAGINSRKFVALMSAIGGGAMALDMQEAINNGG